MTLSIGYMIPPILLFFIFQQCYCGRMVENIGSHSVTTFQLIPGYESSEKLAPTNVLTGIGTVHQCPIACSQDHMCLSFNYKPTKNQTCEMFDDIDEDPIKVGSGGIYGKATNRRRIPFDCVQSAWSEWSECGIDTFWDNCGITNTSKVECFNVENRTREVIEPDEYGGVTCHTYEQRERNACSNLTALTHILLSGGRNGESEKVKTILDFVPDLGRMLVLSQELVEARDDHTSVLHGNRIIMDGSRSASGHFGVSSTESIGNIPLQHVTLASYISKQRYGGCSVVVGSNLYHCFGRGTSTSDYMSHCDVYDMDDNYSHHQLYTNVPAHVFSSCLLSDNDLLYIMGGFTSGGKQNNLYKLDLMTGTKTVLSSLPYAVYGLSSVWYHGNVVACGGHLGGGTLRSATCSEYNISSNTWNVNFPNMVIEKSHFEMVNWGPVKILAIGGDAASEYLSSIEVYDGTAWTLYTEAQLPYPVRGMSAVVMEP